MYALLDPSGILPNLRVDDAVVAARGLVDALPKKRRQTLSPLLSDAIDLREQYLTYFNGLSE